MTSEQSAASLESQPIGIDCQIELLEGNLARLIDWVGKHDTKASVVLGIDTAMLGVLGTLAGKQPQFSNEALISLAAALLPLAVSFLFIYLGNFPKTKAVRPSLLFFATIADLDEGLYKKKSLELTRGVYVDDLLGQCHIISRILTIKFRCLQWAYRMLFLALPFWALSIYLLFGVADAPAK